MKSINEFRSGSKVKDLVAKFFEARNVAHVAHLQTKSYAEHKALGSFYDGLLGLADTFVETYQGQYGIISGYNSCILESKDILEYMEGFADVVKNGRKSLDQGDTHLHNILDEIMGLTYQTIYKLKNLK